MNKYLTLLFIVSMSIIPLSAGRSERKRSYRPSYSIVRIATVAGILTAVLMKPQVVKDSCRNGYNTILKKDWLERIGTWGKAWYTESEFNSKSPIALDPLIRIACGLGVYEITQKVMRELFE